VSAIRDILKKLSGSREAFLPSAQIFPPLDIEQMSAELGLEARGRADGEANLPAPGTSLESSTESAVRSEIDRRSAQAAESYRVQLDLYDGRIRRGLLGPDLRTSIESAAERIQADLRAGVTDDLNRLSLLREQAEGRSRELQAFQRTHGLQRLPIAVDNQTFRWLVIVLLILVESFVNGSFFAKGSESGLIGGVLLAILLSLLNVGGGLVVGRFSVPCFRHRRPSLRMVGAASMAVYVGYVVVLNSGIGHYRDLFVQQGDDVRLSDLFGALHSGLFSFERAESFLLMSLGIVLSVGAVIDGTGFDDPYPGYGAVARLRQQAVAGYLERRSQCVEHLRGLRDDAISEMSEVLEKFRANEHEIQLAVNGRVRLHEDYSAYITQLGTAYARLVQVYREANARTRTLPAPARFDTAPSPPTPRTPLGELPHLTADLGEMRSVAARTETLIREIRSAYDIQVARYPEFSSETLEHSDA